MGAEILLKRQKHTRVFFFFVLQKKNLLYIRRRGKKKKKTLARVTPRPGEGMNPSQPIEEEVRPPWNL